MTRVPSRAGTLARSDPDPDPDPEPDPEAVVAQLCVPVSKPTTTAPVIATPRRTARRDGVWGMFTTTSYAARDGQRQLMLGELTAADMGWRTSPSPEGDVLQPLPRRRTVGRPTAWGGGPCCHQHMTAVSPGPHAEYRRTRT